MKSKKKIAIYALLTIIILIIAAFGLIDFSGLFKSEPKTTPDQLAFEIKKPEIFVSKQKFEQKEDEEDQKADNATVPETGLTDIIEPQDSLPEKSKPLNQGDLASQNSAIHLPTEEQKPAIVETDITVKDDDSLAKSVESASSAATDSVRPKSTDSALSKATDDSLGKPNAPDVDLKTNKPEAPPATLSAQNTVVFMVHEGSDPLPYSILLGSFHEDNHAGFKKSLQKFQKKGMDPFWVKVDLGSKGFWHRVLSGCFQKKSEARAVIRAKNLEGTMVADTKFTVLIDEYKDEPALKQMITSLKTKGYSPYVVKKNTDNYLLYIGAFYSRKVAQRTVDELTEKGVPSEVVLR